MKAPMRHMPDDTAAAASASAPVSAPVSAPASDPADYRKALGCFGTGVTVVTARHEGMDWGMTCNSFSSVSLNPRLVLWSIRKEASSLHAFTQSGGFTVSVLASAQADLAMQFTKGSMPERFAGVPATRQASQRLRLDGAVAWFDCTLHQLVDAGDHHIVIGQVQDFGWHDAAPLSFCRSKFGLFQALPN